MSQSTRGSATVLVLCGMIGVITVAATLAWGRGGLVSKGVRPAGDSVTTPDIATEEYGKRLIAQTTELLGPDVADPKMRYTDSRLACASCHIGAGVEPGNLSLVAAMSRYPEFRPAAAGTKLSRTASTDA